MTSTFAKYISVPARCGPRGSTSGIRGLLGQKAVISLGDCAFNYFIRSLTVRIVPPSLYFKKDL